MGIATFKPHSTALRQVENGIIRQRRFLHFVQTQRHFLRAGDESRAVLQYKIDGKMLDMQSINVPTEYKGQGLAQFLAETAYTTLNDCYMYLRCENSDLEKRIVGPPDILDGPNSAALHPDIVYKLPDCEDFKF